MNYGESFVSRSIMLVPTAKSTGIFTASLGLVKALKNKGQQVDFLIMSATPIPRTLAISMYGDMDVSTIKTMPQGRLPVITKYIHSASMKPILKDLKN